MLTISMFGKGLFAKMLKNIDINGDGIISTSEMLKASQSQIDALSEIANGQKQWNAIRQISQARGEYHSILNNKVKPFFPGGGGRFALMVDELISRGLSAEHARSLAVYIGRLHGKI